VKADLRVGDVVSCGYILNVAPIEGRVIELRRRSDGRPFLMIEILTGPKAGTRVFPSEAWELGLGPIEGSCEHCGRRFRSHPGVTGVPWCYRCQHHDDILAAQRQADPERRSSSWQRRERDRKRRQAS
jgi:hypothetical protein